MNTNKKHIHQMLLVIAIVMLSCTSTLSPALPTQAPGSIETYIAMTYDVIATQTAAFLPSTTPTASLTPLPSNTPTETPTLTPTVIFILDTVTSSPTFTPIPTDTPVESPTPKSGGGTEEYQCAVISTSPETIKVKKSFDGKWTVKNTGTKDWGAGSVDYIYLSGAEIHDHATYDLKTSVNAGDTATIIVDMTAPKKAGYYTTTWSLRTGNLEFCRMPLTIYVSN
jgi:hypothetical protein